MIKLQELTEPQFETYLEIAISNYASEKVNGEDLDQDEAHKLAVESFHSLLPDGIKTKDQHLYSIQNDQDHIGWFWFGKKQEGSKVFGYIYDIYLFPEHRGKGYGKPLMNAIETEIRSKGFKTIRLHVFGHNTIAQKLYLKSGFHITNIMMNKEI